MSEWNTFRIVQCVCGFVGRDDFQHSCIAFLAQRVERLENDGQDGDR